MRKQHLGAALLVVGAVLLVGCGSSGSKSSTASTTRSTTRAGSGPTATAGPSTVPGSGSTVAAAAADSVRRALAEERVIDLTYGNVLVAFPGRNPFANIQPAEKQHVATIQTAAANHGIDVSSVSATGKAAPATFNAACALGVALENEDIALYDALLPTVSAYPDLTTIFKNLQAASRDHLTAFQRCS